MIVSDGRPATIDWTRLPARPCPVAESLDLFGDRWSMLVIRDVMNGVRRFDDLVARLGISRATVADRLRRLTVAGTLVTAEYDSDREPDSHRIPAERTGVGSAPRAHRVLREWGDRHVLGAGNEPLRLVERTTGHGVRLQLVDDETGEPIDGRALAHVPGPAFDATHRTGTT